MPGGLAVPTYAVARGRTLAKQMRKRTVRLREQMLEDQALADLRESAGNGVRATRGLSGLAFSRRLPTHTPPSGL